MCKIVFVCLLIIVSFPGCSSKRSVEIELVKEMLTDSFHAMEVFVFALDSASNDHEIILAINSYENRLDALAPKAEKIKELNITIDSSNPPKELRDLIGKIKYMTGKFMHAYQKVIDNLDNPDVSSAITRMMKKNSSIHTLRI